MPETTNPPMVPTVKTSFGDMLIVPHPPDADVMIVCGWNYQLEPKRLLLPHQLYTKDLKALARESRDGVVVCVPVRSEEYVTVCGDGPLWEKDTPPVYEPDKWRQLALHAMALLTKRQVTAVLKKAGVDPRVCYPEPADAR